MKNEPIENAYIAEILGRYQTELGKYSARYRNHVLRVYHLALGFCPGATPADRDKLAIAAAFHDIGIWTHRTFDYLKPSEQLALTYLYEINRPEYADEVALIINNHHKLSPYRGNALVEGFRRADLVDLSLNLFRFGVKRGHLRTLNEQYAYQGFHRFIFGQIAKNWLRHPFNPLPIVKA